MFSIRLPVTLVYSVLLVATAQNQFDWDGIPFCNTSIGVMCTNNFTFEGVDILNRSEELTLDRTRISSINISVCDLLYNRTSIQRSNALEIPVGDSQMFCGDTFIELSLRNNRIASVTKDYLENFLNLEHLDLSYNYISGIHLATFQNLSKLTFLDLSHNLIKEVHPQTFLLPSLLDLNLSYNRLKTADAWVFKFPRLYIHPKLYVTLNISYNHIEDVSNTIGFSFSDIKDETNLIIDATNNRLTSSRNLLSTFNYGTVNDLIQLYNGVFLLHNNPFHCDCHMYQFMHIMVPFVDYTKLRFRARGQIAIMEVDCKYPISLRGKYIFDLPLDLFQCNISCVIGFECLCTYTPHNDTLRVDCASRGLAALPKFSNGNSYSFYELYLSNNSIQYLDHRNYFQNITILELSSNKLKNLKSATLSRMPSLQKLFLQKNELQMLPDIESWNYTLRELKLGSNPLVCNCSQESRSLKALTTASLITDLGDVKCNEPSWNQGKLVTDVSPDDFVCYKLNIIALSIGLAVPLALIITAGFVAYCSRDYIRLFLFSRFGWRYRYDYDDANEKYDIFISYCNKDEEVVHGISERLEEMEPPFNVCLHYRDFIPGDSIADNIIRSIQASKCTIIMVTNNFVDTYWCKYEFKAAHHEALTEESCKVAVVLLEEVDENKMDSELKLYVKTRTYLKYTNRHFFAQLLLALPVPSGERNPIGV